MLFATEANTLFISSMSCAQRYARQSSRHFDHYRRVSTVLQTSF